MASETFAERVWGGFAFAMGMGIFTGIVWGVTRLVEKDRQHCEIDDDGEDEDDD